MANAIKPLHTLSDSDAQALLARYAIGTFSKLAWINGGTQNHNYFLTTTTGEYVLTVYARDDLVTLQATVALIDYLAAKDLQCCHVIRDRTAHAIQTDKPHFMLITTRLPGTHIAPLNLTQCQAVASWLAHFHLTTANYALNLDYVRNQAWLNHTSIAITPHLSASEAQLLQHELNFQKRCDYSALPKGVIHADLFRDNVLFTGDNISGVIDFYDACYDYLLLDVAISANDACLTENSELNLQHANQFFETYQTTRPFTVAEQQLLPCMQRYAALIFWVLRLSRWYLAPANDINLKKDPQQYQKLLLQLL